MLVLTRKSGEALRIGPDIEVRIVQVTGGQVRIAIDAPTHVAIHREEVYERIAANNRQAALEAPCASDVESVLQEQIKWPA